MNAAGLTGAARGGAMGMAPPPGSSWPHEPSCALLTQLVPGFEAFAARNQVVDLVDLAVWALACGAFDLAQLMWSRCRCPLRAALLLHGACKTINREIAGGIETEFSDTLAEYATRFNALAAGILDHVHDADVDGGPRRVLDFKGGPYAVLGAPGGSDGITVLDLTIASDNKVFAAHRKVQTLMDEHWVGHSKKAGHLRLRDERHETPHLHLVVLQGLLPFAPILALAPNELFDAAAFPITDHLRHVPLLSRVVGVYQIPLVKRGMETTSRLLFIGLFSYAAMSEPCSPFLNANYALAAWTVAYLLEEVYGAASGWALYASRGWAGHGLDLLILLLLFAMTTLRYHLQFETPDHGVIDLVQFMHNRSGGLIRPEPQEPYPQEPLAGNMDCAWSFELEAYQTVTAVLAILVALRTFECFSLLDETGVLMITSVEMFSKMLAWLPLVFFLSLGSAVAMNVLAPNYALEHSPGALHLPLDDFIGDFSAGGPFFSPFWAIYGYVEPGALAQGRGTAFITPLFMWGYLLVSLVLFVNLLIAVFNDAYNAVQEEKSRVWKMRRLLLIKSHIESLPLPAPLNIPLVLFWLVRSAARRAARALKDRCGGGGDGGAGAAGKEGTRGGGTAFAATTHAGTKSAKVAPMPASAYDSFRSVSGRRPGGGGGGSGFGGGASAAAARRGGVGGDEGEDDEALIEARAVEEIERRARMEYLRSLPAELSMVGGGSGSGRGGGGAAAYLAGGGDGARAAATLSVIQERLSQLELNHNHAAVHMRDQLHEIAGKMDRTMTGSVVVAGGGGGGGRGGRGSGGGGGGGRASGISMAMEAMAAQVFQAFDRDKSGDISVDELQPALRQLGMRLQTPEVRALMRRFGGAPEGRLSIDAFVGLVAEVKEFQRVHSKALRVFRARDFDGSGELSRNEMRGALEDLGYRPERLTDEMFAETMAKYDRDLSSGIDLEEFTRIIVDLEREDAGEEPLPPPPPPSKARTQSPAPAPAPAPPPPPPPAAPPAPAPAPAPYTKLSVDDGDAPPPPPPPATASADVLPPEGWWQGITAWWQEAEGAWRQETRRFEGEIHHEVAVLRQQAGALAHVTNHLAQEVARLRPEYWQRAHHVAMAPPHDILVPPPQPLRAPPPGRRRRRGGAACRTSRGSSRGACAPSSAAWRDCPRRTRSRTRTITSSSSGSSTPSTPTTTAPSTRRSSARAWPRSACRRTCRRRRSSSASTTGTARAASRRPSSARSPPSSATSNGAAARSATRSIARSSSTTATGRARSTRASSCPRCTRLASRRTTTRRRPSCESTTPIAAAPSS